MRSKPSESLCSPLPPGSVRLSSSPFATRMEANGVYLARLDPQRLLHNFYVNAGLPSRGVAYGGWESLAIAGHTLGHYLSAISRQAAATRDLLLARRVGEVVNALALCQAHRKTGYVGGIPGEDVLWAEIGRGDIRAQDFDVNGVWVPWYTVHKLFAGLLDAYDFLGDDEALHVVTRLGEWMVHLLSPLDHSAFIRMLTCEYGGMNDVLARLYERTSDVRFLQLALRFNDDPVLGALAAERDELEGKHANTHIPKVIGLARLARISGDAAVLRTAEFFWDRVANHHSYVIGGNSDHEHFGAPDALAGRLSTNTCETCNTYNMLKLSQSLFEVTGAWKYMHFCERALVNHILASQDPETGMFTYYVSLLPGTGRAYSSPHDSFWCCVGSGMENHTKYGEFVAYRTRDGLRLCNTIPCTVEDPVSGFGMTMETEYPLGGHVRIEVRKAPAKSAELQIRIPPYSGSLNLMMNGDAGTHAGDAAALSRRWKAGDVIEFDLGGMGLRSESMPDRANRLAYLCGPNVLAATLPDDTEPGTYDVVGEPKWEPLQDCEFNLLATEGHAASRVAPFWALTHAKTAVYFDLSTPQQWAAGKAEREEKRLAREARANNLIDTIHLGDARSEGEHSFKGQMLETGANQSLQWRHAVNGGWFAFTLAVDPGLPNDLELLLWGIDGPGRNYDLKIEGETVRTFAPSGTVGAKFYEEVVSIPPNLTAGKGTVEVRFEAHPGKIAGGLYRARSFRAD